MKKLKRTIGILAAFFAIFTLIFIGCNEAGEDTDDSKEGEEINWGVDHLFVLGSSDNYPGAEVDLTGRGLLNISKYASITVDAVLYTDEGGTTEATVPSGDNNNLAQFKLLKAGGYEGAWNDDANICGPTKYNMAVNGETKWIVTVDAQGVPAVLLLQANWADFEDGVRVKSIKVKSITFTPKTGDVVLDVVFPESGTQFMEVSGNQVTFKNAMYSDCAALFAFPSSWGATEENSLAGKTITFTYSIPEHVCVPASGAPSGADIEHQIHVQAAHNDSSKDKYNGKDGNPGQEYITLDDPAHFDADTGLWSFSISAQKLINASQASNNASDGSPFVLDAVRIANNGTNWDETGVGMHYRCKSYTLVVESVTCE